MSAFAILQLTDLRREIVRQRRIKPEIVHVETVRLLMVAGSPCTGSLAATPSGSLVSIHARDLVGRQRQPHFGEQCWRPCRSPRRSGRSTRSPSWGRPCGQRTKPATDRPKVMQGTPASSHWSATGLVVSEVDDAHHDVDFVVVDELGGDFGRAVRVRLAVPRLRISTTDIFDRRR